MPTRSNLFNTKEIVFLAALTPDFRRRIETVARNLNEQLADFDTITLRVEDGFRDHETQAKLYAIGRKELSPGHWTRDRGPDGQLLPRVTDAPAGYSAHQYRRACHVVLLRMKNGRATGWLEPRHPLWKLSRDLAKAEGLDSGFDFKSLFDPAHLEFPGWEQIAKLRNFRGFSPEEWK
jgi:hypothetical protein